ncbi:MAG TPA: DUF2275 domain-containing protein [Mycobacterium sp.]|nr:DUF2275 domain-containing protein [Mycobacterium sp.]
MRENGWVDCNVARESLSARVDGEREPVPSARVDEHLAECRLCTEWYRIASEQSSMLRGLAGLRVSDADGDPKGIVLPPRSTSVMTILRCALASIGVIQLTLALAQGLGVDFGVATGHDGMSTGGHLLNESTAWSAALGCSLIAAAARPVLAAGIACVAGLYALLLAVYVTADWVSGHVTAARAASHLPVLAGAVIAFALWRHTSQSGRRASRESASAPVQEVVTPESLSERRRRKPRASNDSAA